jgi:hypothetical protein
MKKIIISQDFEMMWGVHQLFNNNINHNYKKIY